MTNHQLPGPAWIPAFLATLAETGKVGLSVKAAGVLKNAVYWQRKTNHGFAEAWSAVLAARHPAPAPVPAPALTCVPTCVQIQPALPAKGVAARNLGWRKVFLEALAETSNVSVSALRADVPLRTAYKTRRDDPAFAARWRGALHEGYDNLEMEVLGYLRGVQPEQKLPERKMPERKMPERKMDVASALRLLVAHRETVARERARRENDDEQAVLDSIDKFIDDMRERRKANAAILIDAQPTDADDGAD